MSLMHCTNTTNSTKEEKPTTNPNKEEKLPSINNVIEGFKNIQWPKP
jgi:hypothetical protein